MGRAGQKRMMCMTGTNSEVSIFDLHVKMFRTVNYFLHVTASFAVASTVVLQATYPSFEVRNHFRKHIRPLFAHYSDFFSTIFNSETEQRLTSTLVTILDTVCFLVLGYFYGVVPVHYIQHIFFTYLSSTSRPIFQLHGAGEKTVGQLSSLN